MCISGTCLAPPATRQHRGEDDYSLHHFLGLRLVSAVVDSTAAHDAAMSAVVAPAASWRLKLPLKIQEDLRTEECFWTSG